MAEISGKAGEIDSSGTPMAFDFITNWTINPVSDVLDTTNFDVATSGRTFIAGLKSWSGNFDAKFSTGNTSMAGDTILKLIFRSDTSTSGGVYKGDVILTGTPIDTPVDGIVTKNFTFQGTGALAVSSDG